MSRLGQVLQLIGRMGVPRSASLVGMGMDDERRPGTVDVSIKGQLAVIPRKEQQQQNLSYVSGLLHHVSIRWRGKDNL